MISNYIYILTKYKNPKWESSEKINYNYDTLWNMYFRNCKKGP